MSKKAPAGDECTKADEWAHRRAPAGSYRSRISWRSVLAFDMSDKQITHDYILMSLLLSYIMAPTPAKRTHDLINEALQHIGPRSTKKTRLQRITNNDALKAIRMMEDLGKVIPWLIDPYRHPRQLIVIGSDLAHAENRLEITTGRATLPIDVVKENEQLKSA
ncbi:hypothetical protein PTI98_009070 [Pleurotus ostreatus]|nr:hypothetical protein PTI98_009070 [Pleurotus ostreatus]